MSRKLSVITINYNNAVGLERTIKSVLQQSHDSIEYIIVDGGSTDNSVDVIMRNANGIANWTSEPDNGIYHAMNKGIKKAAGDYLLFLNSGDYLHAADSISALFSDSQDEDILYGNLLHMGKVSWVKTHPPVVTFEHFLKDTLPHPGSLIKKELFEKVGLYNETYRIVSDWEFFMNAICRFNASYRYVDVIVSVFNEDGISSNPANDEMINKEKEKILSGQYGAFMPDYRRLADLRSELNLIKISRVYKITEKVMKPFLKIIKR